MSMHPELHETVSVAGRRRMSTVEPPYRRPRKIQSRRGSRGFREDRNVTADVIKGAIAGTLAVWAMDRVGWWLWERESEAKLERERDARTDSMDPAHVVANRIANAAGIQLHPMQPHPAGVAVHYAIGAAPAMLYAPLRHQFAWLGNARGLAYGLALFLVVDEGVVPALGLGGAPGEYPWQAHARGLVTHLILGAVTDLGLEAIGRLGE